ncbi:hypothetical protein D187_002396 [Cystobacter fuscus DSM 2262]|uniref:Uncharacterized protein n=1 Tax=Cystobacter fuscus (strain ATCC 25194 / DSM 2262 / NBRC 100088 / M29) TaxID=1242864 RepID=S9PBL6_CYSF2|nr:hypothetical protein [Cystobacter fuscus]EPX59652.1 hypothetical protein D187_002396 [Cystobacter fuscus DSM 2262]
MSESIEKKDTSKLEENILFEVAELDDAALDAVSGGAQHEAPNGVQCHCSSGSANNPS